MHIWCSRNISYHQILKTVVLLNIFMFRKQYIFRIPRCINGSKCYICNNVKVFTVTFDQFNASLLNNWIYFSPNISTHFSEHKWPTCVIPYGTSFGRCCKSFSLIVLMHISSGPWSVSTSLWYCHWPGFAHSNRYVYCTCSNRQIKDDYHNAGDSNIKFVLMQMSLS